MVRTEWVTASSQFRSDSHMLYKLDSGGLCIYLAEKKIVLRVIFIN